MLSEESYVTELMNSKSVNHQIAINLLHALYQANHQVLSMKNDHNKPVIRKIFQHALNQAKRFDQRFHLTDTCLSIAKPIYVIYDNTPTVDDRISTSEALTKGIMQMRDEALVNSTD